MFQKIRDTFHELQAQDTQTFVLAPESILLLDCMIIIIILIIHLIMDL